MDNNLLEKYAGLIVKSGVNIQKNQTLVITSPIECAAFTRTITKIAYEEGAKDVVVEWVDELLSKIKFLYAKVEVFEEFPEWQKEFYLSYAREGAAFLAIDTKDPELMKDINSERISKASKVRSSALKEYANRKMSGKNSWCIAAFPTKAWAKKVFPNISEDEAIEKLWQAVFKVTRIDEDNDSALSWNKHIRSLKINSDFLNSNEFKYMYYKNSLGTDLKIELPENHIWISGSAYTPEGIEFCANIPTEEIFTLPKKTGINGTVVSSMPLSYNGSIIERICLTFEDGKIVDFYAEKGYEALKELIETDEGSHYLGEVALVPYNSPISKMNTIFYKTLFDENASCHLAIGAAYPCIKNIENMSNEELGRLEINDSSIHVDFMIGTEDLEIIGITRTNEEIPIFKNGDFEV
ncbi:aminopeptidase [Clostridium sediminicola]|uniref:aminopeptidase n=1 Tax=Clostridium sediminicola TaxID=3114879 RepID=UPI0031F1D144